MNQIKKILINRYIARLKQRKGKVSSTVYERVLLEYQNRLQNLDNPRTDTREEDYGLTVLLDRLTNILEELELRQYAEEFDSEDIKQGLQKTTMSGPVKELMRMMSNLESYRSSIEALTGLSSSKQATGSRSDDYDQFLPGEFESDKAVDIDKVLEEFDSIDVFASFEEGDAVYDSQYEEEDKQILNEIFFHILDGYLDPLVVGFRAIIGGNNTQKLFGALLASIRPLRRSAETMGFQQLTLAFSGLESILVQAQSAENMIPADRIHFVKAYGELSKCLPKDGQYFGLIDILDSEKTASSMILDLIRSNGVEGWMIQALLEIGLTDSVKLNRASPEEVKALTGLPYEQCRTLLITCRNALGLR